MDTKVGLQHRVSKLLAVADILPVWLERGHLWLLNYEEEHQDRSVFELINEAKLASFPEEIRTAIGNA